MSSKRRRDADRTAGLRLETRAVFFIRSPPALEEGAGIIGLYDVEVCLLVYLGTKIISRERAAFM